MSSEVEFGGEFQELGSCVDDKDTVVPQLSSSSSSSSSSNGVDDDAFNVKNLSSFVGILTSSTVLVKKSKTIEPEKECPFSMLSRFFGVPDERISSVFPTDENDGSLDYDEVFRQVTNVLSVSTVSTPFSSIANAKHFSLDREHPTELDYLKDCADNVLPRRSSHVVSALFHELPTYKMASRLSVAAQALTIVHVLKKVFAAHRKEIRTVMGSDDTIEARATNSRVWREIRKIAQVVQEGLVVGEWDTKFVGGFIYEVLATLSSNTLIVNHFTKHLLSCEYHVVRAAVDATNERTLRICALSSNYISQVWLGYMQFYYPRVFKECREDAPLLTWESLDIYTPLPCHVVEHEDINPIDEIAQTLLAIFSGQCSSEFLKKLKIVHVPKAFGEIKNLISEARGVRATRTKAKLNYSDTKRRGSKRQRS